MNSAATYTAVVQIHSWCVTPQWMEIFWPAVTRLDLTVALTSLCWRSRFLLSVSSGHTIKNDLHYGNDLVHIIWSLIWRQLVPAKCGEQSVLQNFSANNENRIELIHLLMMPESGAQSE